MSELLRLILANALAAGLLALAAWAVSRRLRRQTLVHGLWVLALVKLVTPPDRPPPVAAGVDAARADPSGRTGDGRHRGRDRRGPDDDAGRERPPRARWSSSWHTEGAALPALAAPGGAAGSDPGRPRRDSRPVLPPLAARESTATRAAAATLPALAWAGLLAGALAVGALTVLRVRRFRRLLRLAAPAPPALAKRTAELAERLALRRTPPVLLLPARVPPMLWPGRRGPLLLMPADLLPELSDEQRDTLLVHELAHVRRRDHWVRMLELAVTVVFWWYPVTWWVRRALRRAEERCCDEWVLRVMPASAKAYAEGLLKSLDFVAGEPDPLPVGASGAGPVRDLEARLKEILMMTRPTPRLTVPARLALAAAAAVGLAAFPTQAQSPAPDEEPVLASPAEAELPPAPPAPEIVDTAEPAPPAPPAPAPPAAEAAPRPPPCRRAAPAPALAAPAAPLLPDDAPPPALAAPAPPAPPDPVVARPMPEPRPVVRPHPGPEPRPVVRPRPLPSRAPWWPRPRSPARSPCPTLHRWPRPFGSPHPGSP